LKLVDLGWWYTVKQREPRPRSHKVRYSFSGEEEELSDTDDEIQGYLCVSEDPRRSGSAEGGENFVLTTEELRLSIQAQCRPSVGETYGPMSPPGDINPHSSATAGIVITTPSPLNKRN
jgi:hypothetical protein